MERYRMRYLAFLLLSLPCLAQQQVVQQPQCSFNFGPLTAPGATAGIDFHNQGCMFWTFEYKSTGFSVLSIVLQGAPDSAGSPGTFVTLPGTVTVGANPSTSITGAFAAITISPTNAAAWIRINLTSVTGTGSVTGRAYGYQNFPGASSSSGCPNPCPVDGPDAAGSPPTTPPVQQGVFDGTNVQRAFIAPLSNAISLSAGTDVVIVAGTAATTTYVVKFDMSWDNAAAVTIRQGTGTTCLTNTLALSGAYNNLVALFEDYTPASALRNTIQGRDICLHFSTSVTGGGQAIYTQF
jgi:hypothetical protein